MLKYMFVNIYRYGFRGVCHHWNKHFPLKHCAHTCSAFFVSRPNKVRTLQAPLRGASFAPRTGTPPASSLATEEREPSEMGNYTSRFLLRCDETMSCIAEGFFQAEVFHDDSNEATPRRETLLQRSRAAERRQTWRTGQQANILSDSCISVSEWANQEHSLIYIFFLNIHIFIYI